MNKNLIKFLNNKKLSKINLLDSFLIKTVTHIVHEIITRTEFRIISFFWKIVQELLNLTICVTIFPSFQ